MINVLADASLPNLKTAFPEPFHLSFYHHPQEIPALLSGKNILLCRSTLKVNASLLGDSSLDYVATASSGIDHLDEAFLTHRNITLVDAKGCNAPAVADYVMATLASLLQHHPFHGQSAGIIGCGEVGSRVAQRLKAAQWTVNCFDPPKAAQDPSFQSDSLQALAACDLLCIHANLHNLSPYPSQNLLNADFFRLLKPGTVIINASRGGIVNEADLLHFPQLIYCTDVYANEPRVNEAIVSKAVLCTPHIAGHSVEAKLRAITLLSNKLHHYYGLKPLCELAPLKRTLPLSAEARNDSWPALLLSLYNPARETDAFKHSDNKESAFLQLRKAHTFRHDFSTYDSALLNPDLKQILGAD